MFLGIKREILYHIKINYKGIIDLSVRTKTVKLVEKIQK